MWLQLLSLLIGILFAGSIIIVRLKASNRPTNARKILIPPMGMSTGFLMFIAPQCRVPWLDFFEALVVGAIFSILLVKTSKFEIRDEQIYLKRSKAFAFVLIGLLIVRVIIKIFVEQEISYAQTGALFFVLAFGMILPWRVAMYIMYKRLEKQANSIITTT
ncbi:cytochrome c biogenesis protein CcdC [Pullulanibacillus sp. KACC 23026]|uniref:CcdC family protein n=1 Tax=Pullulanibacillus sp. KACC 23026 TaxID=3028315 RepID=UPI0023B01CCB|nr:cytochrome c biogenesis protein CcdC [Pullulanibacillus sp. KACC 23026]WEG11526.1 cytochrome c biogenesis protein CcdC [Pullulanibacillus sp. KACC 23026]